MSRLVFLHGLPGSGKLTVGRALQSLTGFRLFHNHLAVDLLGSVFEFGSPPFIELREHLWLSVFREAARNDLSLIFTFAPERTVRHSFPAAAESVVQSEGGQVLFVELRCPESVLEDRMSDASRSAYGKLNSAQRYRELRESGTFAFAPLRADLALDTGTLTPLEAARKVSARLAAA